MINMGEAKVESDTRQAFSCLIKLLILVSAFRN
jgi:hypothetical protein